eukprot:1853210-Alexandrium_andersonii.AAC.1
MQAQVQMHAQTHAQTLAHTHTLLHRTSRSAYQQLEPRNAPNPHPGTNAIAKAPLSGSHCARNASSASAW